MIITIVLTKTTNCTFRAEKVEGHDRIFFPALRTERVPPLSNLFQHHCYMVCFKIYEFMQ